MISMSTRRASMLLPISIRRSGESSRACSAWASTFRKTCSNCPREPNTQSDDGDSRLRTSIPRAFHSAERSSMVPASTELRSTGIASVWSVRAKEIKRAKVSEAL